MTSERFFQGLYYDNLGISLSAGTLTIMGANGRDLSTSNPAVIVLPSNVTPGEFVRYNITSNYTIDDTSAGTDLDGALWGTTTSVAWGSSMPLFIYFVSKSDDTAVIPCLARKFWNNAYCLTGDMKVKGTNTPVDEEDFISMVSGITAANYENTSTAKVGYFTATKDASDDWAFDSLTYRVGIGLHPTRRTFNLPALQNGATNGFFSSSNGGDTVPTWNNQNFVYMVHEDGTFSNVWTNSNAVTVAGSGSGRLRIHLPFSIGFSSTVTNFGTFEMFNATASLFVTCNTYATTAASDIEYHELLIQGNGTVRLTPSDITTDFTAAAYNSRLRAMRLGS